MKTSTCALLVVLLAFPLLANAQFAKRNIEFSGGYAHITGDQGLDGFNAGAALYFTPRISIGFDYDSVWDTSTVGPFGISEIGQVSLHSNLQDFLFGPRIFFPGLLKGHGDSTIRKLKFFGEAQFGISHLSSTIKVPIQSIDQSSSDNAFTWMLGGGADYRLNHHWTARGKVDLERTHFENQGQSRLRIGIGVSYAFGKR